MPPLTVERAAEIGSMPKQRFKKAYYQAVKLQGIIEGMMDQDKLKPTEASSLIRAWVEVNGVRRIELGLGAPKTVPAANDPAHGPARRKRGSSKPAKEEFQDGPE